MSRTIYGMPTGPEVPRPQVELVETDGEPLESLWHHSAISLLIEVITCHLRGRDDYYVAGNMFIYYSEQQARNKDYKGPDFFFVKGVDRKRERRWWALWEENWRYPNFILELLSPSTEKEDRTTKKVLYESTFHTPEYFLYDPESHKIEGWRLDQQSKYQPLSPNENGWLWSEELGLWLGNWLGDYLGQSGVWPRFYDAQGALVPIPAEVEHRRAEEERQRAEAERQRAEAERQRAETAEAELARLKAQLAQIQREKQQGP